MFSVAALGNTQNFGKVGFNSQNKNMETTGSVASHKPLFQFKTPETTGSVASVETTGSVASAGQGFSMVA